MERQDRTCPGSGFRASGPEAMGSSLVKNTGCPTVSGIGRPAWTAQVGNCFQDLVVDGRVVVGYADGRTGAIVFFPPEPEQAEESFKNPFHRQMFLPDASEQLDGGGQ